MSDDAMDRRLEQDSALSRLIDLIFEDKPLKHECENCGDAGMAPATELPAGWFYLSRINHLPASLDEVDSSTRILCGLCAAVVEAALGKVSKVPA